MSDTVDKAEAWDELAKKNAEIALLKEALTEIAAMADPDEIDEDNEGFTEWGCGRSDAIEMAYENCITIAQLTLGKINHQ